MDNSSYACNEHHRCEKGIDSCGIRIICCIVIHTVSLRGFDNVSFFDKIFAVSNLNVVFSKEFDSNAAKPV